MLIFHYRKWIAPVCTAGRWMLFSQSGDVSAVVPFFLHVCGAFVTSAFSCHEPQMTTSLIINMFLCLPLS